MSLTYGSLFSGIGGLDLGLDRAGFTPLWNSEIDPYASKVLARHWPHVPNLGDITSIDWSSVERPDLICGGYPCPPFSVAGDRLGSDDPRHLWPVMADALRVLRPTFLLLENVTGHLSLGFDDVLADLDELGFDAEWSVVSACSVGAPHMRKRLFCLAYPQGKRWGGWWSDPTAEGAGEPSGPGTPADWLSIPEPRPLGLAHGLSTELVRGAQRSYGNAVVPQVAELIGRRIMAHALEAAS